MRDENRVSSRSAGLGKYSEAGKSMAYANNWAIPIMLMCSAWERVIVGKARVARKKQVICLIYHNKSFEFYPKYNCSIWRVHFDPFCGLEDHWLISWEWTGKQSPICLKCSYNVFTPPCQKKGKKNFGSIHCLKMNL